VLTKARSFSNTKKRAARAARFSLVTQTVSLRIGGVAFSQRKLTVCVTAKTPKNKVFDAVYLSKL
jgi:hypothetical protein